MLKIKCKCLVTEMSYVHTTIEGNHNINKLEAHNKKAYNFLVSPYVMWEFQNAATKSLAAPVMLTKNARGTNSTTALASELVESVLESLSVSKIMSITVGFNTVERIHKKLKCFVV